MTNITPRQMLKLCVFLLFITVINIQAQNVQYTEGKANSAVSLSSRVDPTSLGLNLTIQLGSYPGRQNNLPVVLRYNSKVWNIKFSGSEYNLQQSRTDTYTEPFYSLDSSSGWSSNLSAPTFDYADTEHFDEFGNGVDLNNPRGWESNDPYYVVPRILIRTPDGASHEFRRGDWIAEFLYGRSDRNPNIWVGDFYSVDGSKLRYNVEERTLYLPDGSRYTHETNSGFNKFIDINGNTLTLNSTSWTDTMGRQINLPPSAPASPQDLNYSLPGKDNSPVNYVFKWRYLADSQTVNQQLRYQGDCSQLSQPLSPSLFRGDYQSGYVCDSGQVPFNPIVLSEIVLPNGTNYKFTYNVWGEIDKIVYPSGAYERFEHNIVFGPSNVSFPYNQANRGVVNRWVSEDGNASSETHWQYGETAPGNTFTINPDNTKSERYYQVSASTYKFGFEDKRTGDLLEEKLYNSAGNLVARTLVDYQITGMTGTLSTNAYSISYANRDSRPSRRINIIFEAGSNQALASMSETTYDSNADFSYFSHLNPKQIKNYNYLALNLNTAQTASLQTIASYFANTIPQSISEIDYLYDPNYKAKNIIGLPTETRDLNPINPNDILGKSQNVYDEQNQYYSIIDYGSTVGYESPVDANALLRGNVTTTRRWVKETNSWIETHAQFDNFGNLRKQWDASGDITRFVETEYGSEYKYAYPTKVITPAPDSGNTGHGTTESSFATTSYDLATGLPLTSTDEFGQTTKTDYDIMLRPFRVSAVNFTAPVSETVYGIPDSNTGQLPVGQRFVKIRKQIDQNNWGEATTWFDGLGRTYKTQAKDSQGDVFVETKYDRMGRVQMVTNPYRQGETVLWNLTEYDEAGRVKQSRAPVANQNPANPTGDFLGTVSYDISTVQDFVGTVVVSTDASGRKSRSITNALGQLTRVDEATAINGTVAADLGSLQYPNQPTVYKYDAQGKMVRVQQDQQSRYFLYDSLGRLIRVRQPEQEVNNALNTSQAIDGNTQWTAGFTYDNLGNLRTTTDSKGTVIVNDYDKAGRVITRTFSSEPQGVVTPAVNYYYDGKGLDQQQSPNYAKGKLTKVANTISETRYTVFDNLGRLKASEQRTPLDGQTISQATPRVSGYTYNFAGALEEETYPSGRVVKNSFETDGDLMRIYGKANAAAQERTYADSFSYTADGKIASLKLGNNLWESAKFNTRLQLTELALGNAVNDGSLWKLGYEYGELNTDGATVNAAKNTGNIAKQTISFNGLAQPFVQTYRYDALNRLKEAKEVSGTTQTWQHVLNYDRYGNRLREGSSKQIGNSFEAQTNLTFPVVDANTATNRFSNGQGYGYEKSGNIIVDPADGGRSFTFNGENKQTEVRDASNNVVGRYYYDGEGKRVKKVTNLETTVFVYSNGKLIAEYSTAAPPQNPTTSYTATDQLGSPRVITNSAGEVVSRRDFMPFGEEIYPDTVYRKSSDKYGAADSVRQRFTGYQKDIETQLDYAEARMYNNQHGRFTAVDPLLASGKSANPQTFNRYSYVMNRPLSLTDSSGLQAGTPTGKWYKPITPDGVKTYTYNSSKPDGYEELTERNKLGELTGPAVGLDDDHALRFNPLGPFGYPSTNDAIVDLAAGALGGSDYFRNGYDVTFSNSYLEKYVEPVVGVRDSSLEFYMTVLPVAQGVGSLARAGSSSFLRNVAFATERDGLVAYSGGAGKITGQYADNYALNSGRQTINQTPGGKVLDSITNFKAFGGSINKTLPEVSDKIWGWGSRHFVQGASGKATFIQGGRIRPNAIWLEEELGLSQNPNVTGIQRFRVPSFARSQ